METALPVVFTALMAGTYKATAPMVAASALAEKQRLIGEVLPGALYDNDLMADAITLAPQKALGLDDETRLWRARKNGVPVALVLEAAAGDGYSGRIGLIVAVAADGKLIAADAKVSIDDNALYRHPEYSETADDAAEDEIEAEAARRGIARRTRRACGSSRTQRGAAPRLACGRR